MDREFAQDLKDPEFVTAFIKEWNESRLDMFALSPPNENLVFSGVMRFYFQDRGQKAATKCIRVTNLQTVADVMTTLIEKFCPDMKMLSTPNYELYEIHGTGDVRKLQPDEFPLLVQLLWHNDDREGRFVLKSADLKIQPAKFFELNQDEGQLKRRLSRREKKDLKKKRKEQLRNRSEEKLLADHVYRELPESSFTRTISNPEAVMRRRRQQKLEKRMKEFSSKGGGPQTGGILKIFAESLKPEIPYKTILASVKDNADVITKAALDKFLLSKEDPAYYCIVMAIIPHGDNISLENAKERVIRSSDCPLAIQNSWPKNRGLITFHLRRRAEGSVEPKREHEKTENVVKPPQIIEKPKPKPPPVERNVSNTSHMDISMRNSIDDEYNRDNVPYFLELTPEGKEINYKPKIYYIKPQETIIGSSRNPSPSVQYLQLFSPKILASHCSIVNADGSVSIVPHGPEADVRVGGDRVYDNTLLQTGDVVQFGGLHTFRFCNPLDFVNQEYGTPEEGSQVEYPHFDHQKSYTTPPVSPELIERMLNEQIGSNIDDVSEEEIETTFGVDGEVETSKTKKQNMSSAYSAENLVGSEPNSIRESFKKNRQSAPDLTNIQDPTIDENLLPASLTFLDHGKDAFFATVTSEVNGSAVSFKLAPTYTLYLAARHLLSPSYRPGTSPADRSKIVATITKRIATSIQQTIQENDCLAGGLAFWMANASELLHFYRQDIDLGPITQAAQAILAQSIQESFALLVNAMEEELALALPAFLDPTDSVDILPHDLDAILNDDLLERAESMELLNWTTANGDHEFHDPRLDKQSYNGEQWITPAARIRYHGIPIMADVLYILSSAMSLLRRCRVNAALTIQLFSQLFHFINMWTFNRIVLEPDLKLCSRLWGHCLRMRLSFIEAWAERQGLELAADCHLARVVQAAHLLEATKDSAEAIADVASACFKLNSLQLRTLLENYLPEMDEPIIPQELIDSIVSVAESTADELTQTDGREVKLEEDIQLQLPFLLPEEGYSSDIIRGVPPGLQEFLEPLCSIGVCELTFNIQSHGLWTVYQVPYSNMEGMEDEGGGRDSQVVNDLPIQRVTINKGKSGLGLSICATKGAQSEFTGIYIKAVIVGGLADQDGRLEAGDQILSVNESSLIDVSQTQAAKIMGKCGAVITLEVMKGAAFYHGLSKLVEDPLNLGPHQKELPKATHQKQRSNEDVDMPQHVAPVLPVHVKQKSNDSLRSDENMAPPSHVAPPPPVHIKQKSNDSRADEDMAPPRHVAPPPPVHRKQKSNDSLRSDEDMAPPRHVAPPPAPAHRKQKSNDSSRSDEAPPQNMAPPPPVHRKQKNNDRSNEDTTTTPPPPPRTHKKKRGNDSSKTYTVDETQLQSDVVVPPIVEDRVVDDGKKMVTEEVNIECEEIHADEGEQIAPVEIIADSPAIENDEQQQVTEEIEEMEEIEIEEELAVEYNNDSDYDSDGNIMTTVEKEKRARQLQRQREYDERLEKWEEQRKQKEEEERLQKEAVEKQRKQEEFDTEKQERERLELAAQQDELKKRQADAAAKEEERLAEETMRKEVQRLDEKKRRQENERLHNEQLRLEEERRLQEEEQQRRQEEQQRRQEERRLQEEQQRRQQEQQRRQEEQQRRQEEQEREEEEEREQKRLEQYRIEVQRLKEEERLKEEATRNAEKLHLIEERRRKEEEEGDVRARRRSEGEEKRRLEYEAHVERRRIEHEKMLEMQKNKEDEKKELQRKKEAEELQKKKEAEELQKKKKVAEIEQQKRIEEEEKAKLAAPRTTEKRDQFNAEMSSLDEALREAERIAAEMDMFMMEEEQKMEDDSREKREKEKLSWEKESVPPIPTSPVNYQLPSIKNTSQPREAVQYPPPPAQPVRRPGDDEEKTIPRDPASTNSLRSQLSTGSVAEQQQKWLTEQREKKDKYRQEQERIQQQRVIKEEEDRQRKIKEIEMRKEQENRQMEEYRMLREETAKKEAASAVPKIAPKPKPKNYKLKNGTTDLSNKPVPTAVRKYSSSSSEEEEAPPRPPPPKPNVKSPSYPVSPDSPKTRNSNGYPDYNRNISQSKPPERVAPPSPPEKKGVYRTPEAAVVNQGVDVPEGLDFKSKMKLFGKFQG